MSQNIKELILQIEANLSATNQSIVQYCSRKEVELHYKQITLQTLVQYVTQNFQVEKCAMEQEKTKLTRSLKEKEVAVIDYNEKYTG